MVKIAIHQPNFFPCRSYFDKLHKADVFVLLGNVQYERQNYQNRFKLENHWHTMSVNKGMEPILNKTYLKPKGDFKRITVNNPKLESFTELITDSLYITNERIIREIARRLGYLMGTDIVPDYPTELKSTERLVDICKSHKADVYLSGQGGKHYLDLELFKANGIKVEFQETNIEPIINYL
jgi:hypothetical protein